LGGSASSWGRAPALRKPLQVQAVAVEIIIGTSMKGGKREWVKDWHVIS